MDALHSLDDRPHSPADAEALAAFAAAARRITPVWDVRDYVAVNPFFGWRDRPFLAALTEVQHATGRDLLPARSFFVEKFLKQEVQEQDLQLALVLRRREDPAGTASALTLQSLLDFIHGAQGATPPKVARSLSEALDRQRCSSLSERIDEVCARWVRAYFDEGQALWKHPTEGKTLFQWWRELAPYDDTLSRELPQLPELQRRLSPEPARALGELTAKLRAVAPLGAAELESYFYHLLQRLPGWAAFLKRFEFEAQKSGDERVLQQRGGTRDLLVMRLCYEVACVWELNDPQLWTPGAPARSEHDSELRYLWLSACELAYQRELAVKLAGAPAPEAQPARAQLAFCIDVRSEVLRRHLEAQAPDLQTIGFAGFFGLPIAVKGLGHAQSDPQCPVLLHPQLEIQQAASAALEFVNLKRHYAEKKHLARAVTSFASSSFSFVESAGLGYLGRMLRAGLARKRPNIDTTHFGLSRDEQTHVHHALTELPLERKLSLARSALTNMGLVKDFAPLVVLVGHGGETSNNPFAGALDCGTCAGHQGLANAQILCDLLNDSAVRAKLSDHDLRIPAETLFIAGLHNTTRDEVRLEPPRELTAAHAAALSQLRRELAAACRAARRERGLHLGLNPALTDHELATELAHRATDWSEVRPEWGLARNASFLVMPRRHLRGIDLEGRSFLHDYDFATDPLLTRLELIMTAPMIVTNWINMQYYASTIDPQGFGTGDKTIANVAGLIGCVQGNGGDLATGLSEQSVRRHGKYFHEPLRLSVVIEAPTAALDAVIQKHAMVRELVDAGWLRLISRDPQTTHLKLRHAGHWLATKEIAWN